MKSYTVPLPLTRFAGRSKITITFIVAIAVALTALLITGFIFKEQKRQLESTQYRLKSIANRDAAIVHNLFDHYIDTLSGIAVYLKSYDDLTSEETIRFLNKMADAFEFESLSIAYSQNDQIFITDVTSSAIDGIPIIYIQVPVYKNGLPVASLTCGLQREQLNNRLKPVLSEQNKYFYIIDGNGEYVAFDFGKNPLFSADVNFFDSLDTFTYGKGFSKELIKQAFTNAETGHTEYSFEGAGRYGYYSPVGINNWVMLSVTSKNAIDEDINRFLTNALILATQILLIFSAVTFFVYGNQKKARVMTQLDEKCFRILAEHTGKVVLEWDYSKKIMSYPNFEKTIGQKPLTDSLRSADEAINAGAVHPDDYDVFRKMFSDVMNGLDVETLRLRMRAADEDYRYYSISSVVVCDDKGKPYKSIGFLENVDLQVKKEKYLRQKATIDQLTKLYNKAAAEALIAEALSSSNNDTAHALLCLDLDNFKGINDELGHLYGDKVLRELSASIRKLFRTSDILGRFGGDEFVVFVRDIPNIEFVREKAAELNKSLNKTYRKGDVECTVSASIGIAVFPTDGTSYDTLYKKADEASYIAKNSGKNLYCFVSV